MSIITKLLATCDTEWDFFQQSRINGDGTAHVGVREYDDGGWQRVGDYWKFIGGGHKNLTGKDRGIPWSAAFVSWCMDEAGAGAAFPYSAAHAKYINRAISNAAFGSGAIVGHRLSAYAPKVGDLIGYWWGGKEITYDNAVDIRRYQSHTDIVVEVGDGVAYSIGGNVLHSVTRRAVRLDEQGLIIDNRQNWFVVIENMM